MEHYQDSDRDDHGAKPMRERIRSVRFVPAAMGKVQLKTSDHLVPPPISEITHDLRQKPRPEFALIDPVLNQAGCGDVIMPLADFMR
jgi:hypothetical protein